ncbi:MAG: tetratricopeptide repeat protein [Planctomycetota bacterium]|nr:tetratricopeptide repeat protein [Planctomycetota bacterium]
MAGVLCAGAAAGLLIYARWEKAALTPQDVVAASKGEPAGPPLRILYPQEGVLFPPDIAAPTFRWKDSLARADTWVVAIGEAGGIALSPLLKAAEWTPSDEQWETIKKASLEKGVSVAVYGVLRSKPDRIQAAGRITIHTSRDEVGAPIFYREVNLPFLDAVKDPSRIRWRFGPVSSRQQPRVLLTNLPVCGNCHSFSADGSVLGMDVDYANDKGSYLITPVSHEIVLDDSKIITWSDYRRDDGEQTFGLLSQVSPSGRYVVSTVKDRSVFVPRPDLAYSQLFFPLKGILVFYDRRDKTFHSLPGADDPAMVQSNASWSPDEKEIVFARAPAHKLRKAGTRALLNMEEAEEFLHEGKTFLFDLYRLGFHDGQGGRPEPLVGASGNGKSNYFPRFSPDGKWIVFCQARSFMLLQPDSELYIIPAQGGQARRLECNTPGMNSWHSWSPNSKWLVFSSKVNGPYTQLFLTHIDADGHSSPAVLLERFTSPDRAANIPEFVAARADAIRTMREQFVGEVSFFRAGVEYARSGDFRKAEKAFRKALEINPKYAAAHNGLGYLFAVKENFPEAAAHFEKAAALSPRYAAAHSNLGFALCRLGRYEPALACFRKAIEINPNLFEAYNNWGNLLVQTGKLSEAVEMFEKALKINPDSAGAHNNLGAALIQMGRLEQGIGWCEKALRLRPPWSDPYVNLGIAFTRLGQQGKADENFRRARELDPQAGPPAEGEPALMDELGLYDSPVP